MSMRWGDHTCQSAVTSHLRN